MKQIIINLTRIGFNDGGSQNACSFIQELSEQGDLSDYCVVAFKNSNTGRLAEKLGFHNILINRNILERISWDFFCRKYFEKGQVCFTFFGSPWFSSQGYLINISGVADSNLYYPEISFWKHCNIPERVKKYIKDRGRMNGYSWADYWVFETDILAQRAIDLANYPENRVGVVKMAASTFVTPERIKRAISEKFRKQMGDCFSLLFLAGANPNKRIINIAPVIAKIKSEKLIYTPIKVVTTLDSASNYCSKIRREFRRLGIESNWINLGPVSYEKIPSLIDACDVVCLFSVLESFSNNCIEAWSMKKPLLITDADWARSACGKAAVYVSPTNVSQVADAVIQLTQPSVQTELLKHYDEHFSTYPTTQEKCKQYLNCIKTAKNLGCVSRENHKAIKKHIRRDVVT